MKNGIVKVVVFGGVAIALTSCAAKVTQLEAGAQSIVISNDKPASSCQYLGKITAKQSGQMISGQQLEQGAMNLLRNSAYRKNANYIQIQENYANYFRLGYGANSVSSVVVEGDAYSCPAKKSQ